MLTLIDVLRCENLYQVLFRIHFVDILHACTYMSYSCSKLIRATRAFVDSIDMLKHSVA